MELIDKSEIAEEIKKRIKEHHSGYLVCLKDILSFLDTLEVKEVDSTDAFIERACEYMRNHIDRQLTIYHEQTWRKRDEFIEDFKNYMKGE